MNNYNQFLLLLALMLSGIISPRVYSQESLYDSLEPRTSETFDIDFKVKPPPPPPENEPPPTAGGAGTRGQIDEVLLLGIPDDENPSAGTRGEGELSFCPIQSLTSLVPGTDSRATSESWGLTTVESPTIWVNITYKDGNIETFSGVLSVKDISTGEITTTSLPLPEESGAFSFTLPQSLEQDQWYHWSLEVNCFPEDPETTLITTQARIYRQDSFPLTSLSENPTPEEYLQRVRTYADEGVWYDALQESAQLYCLNPDQSSAQKPWNRLLNDEEIQFANGVVEAIPSCASAIEPNIIQEL